MDLAAPALSAGLLKPLPTPATAASFAGVDETTKRAQIAAKAKEFEQSFLSIMFGQMYEGTTRTLFGGGEGEAAFTGFLTDAMAKSVEKHGGVGLAKTLSAEMLKLQGLAVNPAPPPAASPKAASPTPSAPTPSAAVPPTPSRLDIAA